MWLLDTRCGGIVGASWRSTTTLDSGRSILWKSEKRGNDLGRWNYDCFGNIRQELEKKKKLLDQAENEARRSGSKTRVRELLFEINVLLD